MWSLFYLDISVEQARRLGLTLNKISGTWDQALLARLLAELQMVPDLDLSLSGFDDDEKWTDTMKGDRGGRRYLERPSNDPTRCAVMRWNGAK